MAAVRAADHAQQEATRLETAAAELDVDATTASDAEACTASLYTSSTRGRQAEGVALADMGCIGSAVDNNMADRSPEFGAAYDIAAQYPSNHATDSAIGCCNCPGQSGITSSHNARI